MNGNADGREGPLPFFFAGVVSLCVVVSLWVLSAGAWTLVFAGPLAAIGWWWILGAHRVRDDRRQYRRLCAQALVPLLLAGLVAGAFTSLKEAPRMAAARDSGMTSNPEEQTDEVARKWVASWATDGIPKDMSANPIDVGESAPIGGGYQVTVLQSPPEAVFAVHPIGSGMRGSRLWCTTEPGSATISDRYAPGPYACGTA